MRKRKVEGKDQAVRKKRKLISDLIINVSKDQVEFKMEQMSPIAPLPMPKSKLLKDRFPDLFKQIHPSKNDPLLDLNTLTYGSAKHLWWKCAEHNSCEEHVWEASVSNRVKGKGCRFCGGKQTCKCDSFGTKFPNLLEEFVAAGNEESIAFRTSCGTSAEFLWKCLKHTSCNQHIWRASVVTRTAGYNCGFCSGNKTCKCDSFGTKFPELLKEFIAAGNDESIAYSTSCGSGKQFLWKCLKHTSCAQHVWKSEVNKRTAKFGAGCVFCTGMQTCKCDSFGIKYPALLKEFVAAGNEESIAYSTPCGSHQEFYWKCLEHKSCNQHVWKASINTRTGKNTKCGFCTGRQTCKCDSFGHKYPELLNEFILAGNDESIAYSTACGSHQEYYWKCAEHKSCNQHVWKTSVNLRVQQQTECGFCSHRQTCKCDSFGQQYPHLLQEFLRAGGTEDEAFSISCGSGKKLQWKCSNGHMWTSDVQNRTKCTDPAGCPDCSTSLFEQRFHNVLDSAKIPYTSQKRFAMCRDKRQLPFDTFFLNNCVGETDGPQHFEDIFGQECLLTTQKHDVIKNKFAADNNLHLFRIAWSERDYIQTHFQNFLMLVKQSREGFNQQRVVRFYGREYGGNNCLSI